MITPVVENYPGFMRIGGKSLVDLIAQQAAQYCEIHVGEFVTEAKKDRQDGRIYLKTNHAIYITKGLIIATGVGNRALEAPGANKFYGRGVSYCATCDGYFFKDGKQVIVVGGGDTAMTDALYLHNLGAKVTLVHRRDTLRAQARLQESFKQSGIPALWDSEVREISGDKIVKAVKIEDTKTGKVTDCPWTACSSPSGIFRTSRSPAARPRARRSGIHQDRPRDHAHVHARRVRGRRHHRRAEADRGGRGARLHGGDDRLRGHHESARVDGKGKGRKNSLTEKV